MCVIIMHWAFSYGCVVRKKCISEKLNKIHLKFTFQLHVCYNFVYCMTNSLFYYFLCRFGFQVLLNMYALVSSSKQLAVIPSRIMYLKADIIT